MAFDLLPDISTKCVNTLMDYPPRMPSLAKHFLDIYETTNLGFVTAGTSQRQFTELYIYSEGPFEAF